MANDDFRWLSEDEFRKLKAQDGDMGFQPDASLDSLWALAKDVAARSTAVPFTDTSLLGEQMKPKARRASDPVASVPTNDPDPYGALFDVADYLSARAEGDPVAPGGLSDLVAGGPSQGAAPRGGKAGLLGWLAAAAAAASGRGGRASRLERFASKLGGGERAERAARLMERVGGSERAASRLRDPGAASKSLLSRVPKWVWPIAGGYALMRSGDIMEAGKGQYEKTRKVFNEDYTTTEERRADKLKLGQEGVEKALYDLQMQGIKQESRRQQLLAQQDRAMQIFSMAMQSALSRQQASDEAALNMVNRYNQATTQTRADTLTQLLAQ